MVDLHCTKIIVRVARSTAANNHTLHMCTLTLANLSGEPANAAQMVDDDAVSALLQLSTLDSDVTRDACSLALANLSHESPPVPTGSVLALIHLGMHGKSSASSPLPPTTTRPPHVTTRHHESSAAPPAYTYVEVDYTAVMAGKYVAEVADRQPPIPHLPTITVDPDSLHASMDNPGGGTGAGTAAVPPSHDHDDLLPAQQLVFAKIEPTDPTNLGGGSLDGGGSGLLDDVQEEHEMTGGGEDGTLPPPSSPEFKHGDEDDRSSHGRGSTSGSNASGPYHDKTTRQLLHLNDKRTTRGLLKKRSNVALLVANAPGSFRPKKSADSEIHLHRIGSTTVRRRPSKGVGLNMSASATGLATGISHDLTSSSSHATLASTTSMASTSKKSVTIHAPQATAEDTPEQRADDLRQQARKMGLWS
ncbi:hypothetical protein H310_13132 [Aphanomyces invadans]|uniref:Uncharacterized protein n=1 Tax=Aphanomyces invadans TaxID=157072 RepID=A0A024TGH5_9STRA|nr:hypothetical protein H310_13132 [Aphanomyces invadans]ETV92696.1 hypothetical protein H310_13132 [Aphanomyces invadans]|eukprot:XP_008878732.1 hypothetical protein H310_13132 [Aphanomyces invadans]